MAYSPGDKIFAKVKGHPHWPSRINLLPPDVPIPKGKYPIFFYGTHEVYFLAPKDIFPYEKFKHKYAIPRNKAVFQAGLREIEEDPDVLLYGKDPQSEEFLARFYKFTPKAITQPQPHKAQPPTDATHQPAANQSGKRVNTSSFSEHTPPAKRQHVETVHRSGTKNKKKASPKAQTSPASNKRQKQNASTKPRVEAASPIKSETRDQSPTTETEDKSETVSVRPKRLAALRLRIHNDGNGLKFSPTHESSLPSMSPSTPGSNETVLAQQSTKMVTSSAKTNTDSLRITIKQLSTSPSVVTSCNVTTSPSHNIHAHSVFSVAQTPTTGLMGVGTDSNATLVRKKSTAVVTPLRRDHALPLPELSDDSSVASTPNTDVETPLSQVSFSESRASAISKRETRLRRTKRTASHKQSNKNHKEPRNRTDSSKLSETGLVRTTPTSEQDSSSTQSPWTSTECEKSSTQMNSGRSTGDEMHSPKTTSKEFAKSNADTNTVCGNRLEAPDDLGKKQKEKQLKDLDTEARLLLIDRSIKSSLVRDHEDIATCVDRLAVLDRMTISLSVLAKCWTVVETIRKCRRYKRSLEVKIAARKVFNKFLQLYATADKSELDLAQAELLRHQQRYTRQHSIQRGGSRQSDSSANDAVVPPYTGPKSMAELFQVSLSERRQSLSDGQRNLLSNNTSLDSSVRPLTETNPDPAKSATSTECGQYRSKPSSEVLSVGFSLSDIPLPEEPPGEPRTRLPNSCSDATEVPPTGENGEEEFEVLDEYEEAGDVKSAATSINSASHNYTATPITTTVGVCDYVPMPAGPYDIVQTQFMPPPNFSAMPGITPNTVVASPSTTLNSFVSSGAPLPNYPAPYAMPYGFGCLPSFTQVLPAPPPAPYAPVAGVVTCSASGSSSYSVSVEATPPQSASRAYVPHALNPPTDPPPPYRPYIPTRCETDQTIADVPVLSPKTRDFRSDGSSSRHSASSSRRAPVPSPSSPVRRSTASSAATRPDSERHSRSSRLNSDRYFRSPPHRTRSPHALPHPLEHYQRCLFTALSSDEDRSRELHETMWSDQSALKQAPRAPQVNTDDLLMRPDPEDLDARIARLIGTVTRTQSSLKPSIGESSGDRRSTNPLGSPPPPPPPPPTSQRILFTHRPPQNPLLSSHPPCPGSHRPPNNPMLGCGSREKFPPSIGPRHSIPPHTPDSPPVRRPSDVDHRLNTLGSVNMARRELVEPNRKLLDPRHSDESSRPVHPNLSIRAHSADYVDGPRDSFHIPDGSRSLNPSGFDTSAASAHRDPSSRPRPSRDEDREIYSMLGV